MDFMDIARKRYSVRAYQPRKVEDEKLMKILEAGRIAPTGANRQPQRLLVIREDEGLEKVEKAARVYGAPLVIIVCSDRSSVWVRPHDGKTLLDIDASIVTDHMMLEATELGLGSVWICYFKPDIIKSEFGLPENLEPINILAIGYAEGTPLSPDRHDTMRKPLNELVFYDTMR